jgi:hypothetical protein
VEESEPRGNGAAEPGLEAGPCPRALNKGSMRRVCMTMKFIFMMFLRLDSAYQVVTDNIVQKRTERPLYKKLQTLHTHFQGASVIYTVQR